jgi:hypothetical protein
MSDLPNKPQGGQCGCGCGTEVKRSYALGHDARHVSKLVAEVLADKRSRSSALRQLESPLLKEKLRKALDRVFEVRRSSQGGDGDAKDS